MSVNFVAFAGFWCAFAFSTLQSTFWVLFSLRFLCNFSCIFYLIFLSANPYSFLQLYDVLAWFAFPNLQSRPNCLEVLRSYHSPEIYQFKPPTFVHWSKVQKQLTGPFLVIFKCLDIRYLIFECPDISNWLPASSLKLKTRWWVFVLLKKVKVLVVFQNCAFGWAFETLSKWQINL